MQDSLLFVNHLDYHGKSNTGMNHPQPAGTSLDPAKGNSSIYMSHFSYACKMWYPLNLVLESWEYLWSYLTFWAVIVAGD